jgi:hypothetical protein
MIFSDYIFGRKMNVSPSVAKAIASFEIDCRFLEERGLEKDGRKTAPIAIMCEK